MTAAEKLVALTPILIAATAGERILALTESPIIIGATLIADAVLSLSANVETTLTAEIVG